MDNKEKKKIMDIVWVITDIIVLISAILLLVDGGIQERIIAILGLLLILAEIILYKKGYILK